VSAPAYDRIGQGYDGTRRPDPRILARLRHHLSAPLGTVAGPVLDIACGTGNYTVLLAAGGLEMVGIDQSATMLAAAGAKGGPVRCPVHWQQAQADALPFPDGAFAGALCSNALHHFGHRLDAVLGEAARVLRPGARLVILTTTREQIAGYWLNAYFPQALARSAAQLHGRAALDEALERAGFRVAAAEPWAVPADPVDLFLYCGKHRPALYLDPQVRAGISTFAALAGADEVAAGLARLERDLETGAFAAVAAPYLAGTAGDYLFLVGERSEK
jgi:ubiquinone/menaquinone biosynthesis C-methylase UbiE